MMYFDSDIHDYGVHLLLVLFWFYTLLLVIYIYIYMRNFEICV
jgi:hypothetical protein